MSDQRIQDVVIVGGGTAGWITAASMSKLLAPMVRVHLIESDDIGTVGVGEATIPQIRRLNGVLGIDEHEFIRETKGTFKLGIQFNGWRDGTDSYLHTFGSVGMPLAGLAFHHYWRRAVDVGDGKGLWSYSLHEKAAYANKFGYLDRVGNTAMGGLAFAFHFDAGLYARFLRRYAEERGARRTEGRIVDVETSATDGSIAAVRLDDGQRIEGDLFIDCSGFRGLLIGGALDVPYHDWSHWLPCNRAVAVPSARTEPLLPYTKATAREAGWQWRIPLQHRTGNGYVFCDRFLDEDTAAQKLLDRLDGDALGDPRVLRFTTGRREAFWHKNCVAIGLSSGFLEPLESTSIHLIQSAVSRLIELFPSRGLVDADIREFNRVLEKEFDLIRDFLILHYHQTERTDTPFWDYVRTMSIPDSLAHKMELFAESGQLYREADDLFREASWIQVMLGQGITPARYHPMADRVSPDQLGDFLNNVEALVAKAAADLPDHDAFIRQIVTAAQ